MAEEIDGTEETFIEFKCPYCGQGTAFPGFDAGSLRDCPYCPEVFLVPQASAEFGQKLPLPIQTPRLVLRRLQTEDVGDLMEFMADEEVLSFLNYSPLDEAGIADWLQTISGARLSQPGQGLFLAIESADQKQIIGLSSITYSREVPGQPVDRQSQINVVISRKFQRQGYATEAVRGLLDFGFRGIGLRRVTAGCDTRNAAGCKMTEKAGMRQEGEFLQDQNIKGEWVNTAWYALLGEEYETAAKGN
ncbi:MAG: ribosomal-protein-alanine N-acetyltransferase [Pedosphaera sp.]|nr:ribosomal-protein-alanine N-acetyltransferase [Pedosphaera sp.]